MIDLKKLEAKFEALFEQETEESFNAWLEEKRKKETLAYLGEGHVELLKRRERNMKTHFYELSQNNSGGSFVVDDNLCHRLIIEAHSEQQAIEKAEELGCYWNGVEDGHDCECCGDRWSQYAHEVDLGRYKETGYKVRVFDHQDDPEGRWRQKYGHYPCLKQPEWETNYGSRSFSGSIYFDSIEQYGQFMADEYGWTAPDVRIFYLDGRKTDILISTSNRL